MTYIHVCCRFESCGLEKRVIEYNYVFLDWKIWIYVVVSNGRISCQIENCVGPARLPNQFFLFSGLHQGHKQISTKSLAISDCNCRVLAGSFQIWCIPIDLFPFCLFSILFWIKFLILKISIRPHIECDKYSYRQCYYL